MKRYPLKKVSIYFMIIFLGFVLIDCYSCTNKEINPIETTQFDTIKTYTNPVGGITQIGDPYVLKYENKYYLYATSLDYGFKVWESSNLVDWALTGIALDRNNPSNQWGTGNFWAPEVKYINGTFYMTYSAIGANGAMKIRIATSKSPEGPFINWSDPFFNNDAFSYIDGDIFVDGTNYYLYYVKDCSTNIINGKHISQIHVIQLNDQLNGVKGDPLLILSPSQDWEGITSDWQWNEGPFVLAHDGVYYLMYSANVYDKADYSIGYATSSSPMGPWTKYAANPILKKDLALKVSGPGHNNVTTSLDGKELFIVYHTHTYFDAPSGDRNMCIDRMYFENGIIKVKGPTRTPQDLPSGDAARLIKKY